MQWGFYFDPLLVSYIQLEPKGWIAYRKDLQLGYGLD